MGWGPLRYTITHAEGLQASAAFVGRQVHGEECLAGSDRVEDQPRGYCRGLSLAGDKSQSPRSRQVFIMDRPWLGRLARMSLVKGCGKSKRMKKKIKIDEPPYRGLSLCQLPFPACDGVLVEQAGQGRRADPMLWALGSWSLIRSSGVVSLVVHQGLASGTGIDSR
jgi:hypothetical protein